MARDLRDEKTACKSYLFAKRTHLNDIYERKANKTTQSWTNPDVPGKTLATQPVFVLTSHDTSSVKPRAAAPIRSRESYSMITS